MLGDLFFIFILVSALISHQIHLVCSDYSKDFYSLSSYKLSSEFPYIQNLNLFQCPEISEFDLIAKIPLIKVPASILFKAVNPNRKIIPLLAIYGKIGYFILVFTILYYCLVITWKIIKQLWSVFFNLFFGLVVGCIFITILIMLGNSEKTIN